MSDGCFLMQWASTAQPSVVILLLRVTVGSERERERGEERRGDERRYLHVGGCGCGGVRLCMIKRR